MPEMQEWLLQQASISALLTAMIMCLLDVMNKENSDIAECSVVKFYEDNRFDELNDDLSVKTYDTQDAMSALIAENPFHQHVWNKLYKTKLVKDIPYAVGKLND